MTLHADQPGHVRPGESLDLTALHAHLAAELKHFDGGALALHQFPSGHSNLTYLLTSDRGQAWVLRRPPFGKTAKTAHDMGREARVLTALQQLGYTRAPRLVLSCADESVIGAPFYLMERVEGVILRPHPSPPPPFDAPTTQGLCHAFLDNLIDLHALDTTHPALKDLGHPTGYTRRQVQGWTTRYTQSQTDDIPSMTQAAAWLLDDNNIPPDNRPAFIHNDYKYDNVILNPTDPTQILAVLDWEMSTVGDPLMDLGTTLGYWLDADDPAFMRKLPFNHTATPGNLNRLALAERYIAKTNLPLDHILFYYVQALFKVAVIAQQIYRRFHDGATADPRFAHLIGAVRALSAQAALAISRRRIDRLG